MTNARVVMAMAGAAMLGAWFSSAAGTAGAPAGVESLNASPTIQPGGQPEARRELERQVARLTERLETAPRPRSPARNPFTLDRPTRDRRANDATAPDTLIQPARPTGVHAPPPVVGWAPAGVPTMTLAGIGVERTPTGRRRTAILSADTRVFLSRVGDEVLGRYQVRDVTDDSVTLLDLQTSDQVRLTLP